jgi:hypothetical protein
LIYSSKRGQIWTSRSEVVEAPTGYLEVLKNFEKEPTITEQYGWGNKIHSLATPLMQKNHDLEGKLGYINEA